MRHFSGLNKTTHTLSLFNSEQMLFDIEHCITAKTKQTPIIQIFIVLEIFWIKRKSEKLKV